MPRSVADLLARLDRWPRRLSALACLLLALASATAARHRGAAPGSDHAARVPVVVAARDLGAGAVLSEHDITTVAWPRELVPVGASGEPERLVGHRLAGPVREREAVTTTRLVGIGLTSGLPRGEVAAVVLTDARVATLIHPGDRVDVLAGSPEQSAPATASPRSGATTAAAILVAERVAVLAVLPPTDAADGGYARVLVATDRGTALRIVALQGPQVLAVIGDPP